MYFFALDAQQSIEKIEEKDVRKKNLCNLLINGKLQGVGWYIACKGKKNILSTFKK